MKYLNSGATAMLLLFCSWHTFGQLSPLRISARSNGMAHLSSCLTDTWALFNNNAGMAHTLKPTIGTSCHAIAGLPGAIRTAVIGTAPTKISTFGFGIFRLGDARFSEQMISFGAANTIGITSLGVSVNYIQYRAEGFGQKGILSFAVGGITDLTQRIRIGAQLININQPPLSSDRHERLPAIMITGIAFRPTDKIFVSTEIEKDLYYAPIWKLGMEYQALKKFSFRTGCNINPNALFAGIGFHTRNVSIDYAFENLVALYTAHQISIGYTIPK